MPYDACETDVLSLVTDGVILMVPAPVSTASSIQALEMLLLMFSTAFIPTTAVDGSLRDIAGITNERGNVVGLMPHPEHCVEEGYGPSTDGLPFFTSVLREMAR